MHISLSSSGRMSETCIAAELDFGEERIHAELVLVAAKSIQSSNTKSKF